MDGWNGWMDGMDGWMEWMDGMDGKLSVHHFEREALIKLHLEYIKRLLHHRASDVKIIEPNTGGPQESLNEHSERKNYV